MIDSIKQILFWEVGNSERIIEFDFLAFEIGIFIIILCGVFILFKKPEYGRSLRLLDLVTKVACHILLIFGVLVRGNYMFSEVQMSSWTGENAAVGTYVILFSVFRIILFIYIFQLSSKLMQFLIKRVLLK